MRREYFGILNGKEGSYDILVPDFPDCHGRGGTFFDAVEDACASITSSARGLLEAGKDLPEERELCAVLADFHQQTGQLRSCGVPLAVEIKNSR